MRIFGFNQKMRRKIRSVVFGFSSASSQAKTLTSQEILDRVIDQTGGVFRPIGAIDTHALVSALMAHKRIPDALAVLSDSNSFADRLMQADLHLQLGDCGSARLALHGLDDDCNRATLALLDVGIHQIRYGDEAACAKAADYLSAFPDNEQLQDRWLHLLAETDLQGDIFAAAIPAYMATQKPYGPRWRLFIRTAVRRNSGIWVMPQLMQCLAQNRTDAFALRMAMDIAWRTQDRATLTRLVDGTAHLDLVPFKLAKLAMERIGVFPPFERIIDMTIAQTAPLDEGKGNPALARLGGLVGRAQGGIAAMNARLAIRPYLIEARLARAELRHLQGDTAGAMADAQILMQDAPQLAGPYDIAFAIMTQTTNSYDAVTTLLNRRAQFVPRYRLDPARGSVMYDKQRYELALGRDDLAEAAATRSTRPARQLLQTYFPDAFSAPDGPTLSPDRPLGQLGVVAWLGISDEVRWAHTYSILPVVAQRAVLSCEPRLHSILNRSFPTLKFAPVRRRWPLRWQSTPVLRSDIRDITLSGYTNASFLRKLESCDAILFPEEIAGQMLLYATDFWRSHLAGLTTGYLVPDPQLQATWNQRLRRSDRPVVGLIWRSGLLSPSRAPHYLDLADLVPLTKDAAADFVALVPDLNPTEAALCEANNITTLTDVDFADDIETLAALTNAVDLVIGISTLPFELAAAVGTPTWSIVLTPDAIARRSTSDNPTRDQLTLHGKVIVPQEGFDYRDRDQTTTAIMAAAKRDLAAWIPRWHEGQGPFDML